MKFYSGHEHPNDKLQKEENSQIDNNFPIASTQTKTIECINKEIGLKNSQSALVKRSLISVGIFGVLMILPFFEGNPLSEIWAVAFVALWLMVSSLMVALMFKMRANKLETLISRENLLAHWQLTPEQKENYVNYLYEQQKEKNRALLLVIFVIAIVVFGVFILVIDEAQLVMLGVLVGLIAIPSFFAFVMPIYYKNSNAKGDGKILIGGKYAYINGYFHNWDFPLSGLSKIKIIKKPFYGINLVYYYTDRAWQHSEEIFIPVNEDIDLKSLVQSMKKLNLKSKRN